MEIITNKINCMRVSKTSFRTWVLYGPVDQALKTSCQADAVKVVSLHLDDVHGAPVDLELWMNAKPANPFENDEPNPPAQVMLEEQECARHGTTREEIIESGGNLPQLPFVKGVAILTGPGCSDFPDVDYVGCVLCALVGQHGSPHGGEDE